MKKYFLSLIITTGLLITSCSNGQSTKNDLSAKDFYTKIKETPNAIIVDVRTPDEFSKGHLKNALNYDWRNTNFTTQEATLDKTKPAFVYCLGGGRSHEAAEKMRKDGFKEVYELNGGMMKWRAENLPEIIPVETATTTSTALTKEQFNELLKTDKTVLVDFYADWCGPCKKMFPHLEEISKEMASKVKIVRINVDDNQELAREFNIDEIPILQVYKNQKLVRTSVGYLEKAAIIEQLK